MKDTGSKEVELLKHDKSFRFVRFWLYALCGQNFNPVTYDRIVASAVKHKLLPDDTVGARKPVNTGAFDDPHNFKSFDFPTG